MKGTTASPYCGFSRKVVDALTAAGVQQFTDVDILKDEELRWVRKEQLEQPRCLNVQVSTLQAYQ
jgi:glutaredoxin-related protein